MEPLGLPPIAGTTTVQNPLAAPRPGASVGGIMAVKSLQETLDAENAASQARADAANSQPVVQNLVSHIRGRWELAKYAKREIEQQMLKALRSLRGEYDPAKLAQLREQNSSEIYMMLFATKARQAKALLGDVILSTGDDKPWTVRPSPVPTLPQDVTAEILQSAAQVVANAEMSGVPMSVDDIRQMLADAKDKAESAVMVEARSRCRRAEKKIEDMLAEGGFIDALDQYLDDLMWSKTAFIKGPIVRKTGTMSWVPGPGGTFEPRVVQENKPFWERVDPLNLYPAPWARGVNDGPLIERHRLSPSKLSDMRGVPGYSTDAIDKVMDEYSRQGLHDWLAIDTERARAEGRTTLPLEMGSNLIDALQFWDDVPGKLLREWGMSAEEVPDESRVYAVEAWLIGNWVIKAVINPDPLARRPYYGDSFKRQAGAFWGVSLYDTMSDCQDMCNAAARALSNNLGIASGPQVWINVDRLPPGEEIDSIYPWKITQTVSDPMGSSAAPMGFFQPTSNANELMGVFEKFSALADEYTGIPRYMAGIEGANGAGRTASGMSMMIGNASKTIKSLVSSTDIRVISPVVEGAYEFVMRYVGDPDVKGDLNVVARGALSLVTKDAAQVRRNEFLNLALNSPVVQQLIGVDGIGELLRSTTKTLDLNSEDIVPSSSEMRIRAAQAALQAQVMQQMQNPQSNPGAPTPKKELMNGQPVTDNFGA